jgi:pimeloyl-ACP methyl ester carboxylesterase
MAFSHSLQRQTLVEVIGCLATVAVLATTFLASPVWGATPRPDPRQAAQRVVPRTHPCGFDRRTKCGHIVVPLDRSALTRGHLRIHFELTPRRDKHRPSLGTIVAVEGGPGYSSTGSRNYYKDLFRPLLGRRQLLIVDNRGTGLSEPIVCPRLQSYRGNRDVAIGQCGRKLGARSDLYGTAMAADDLAAVLRHLRIGKVDLYGDSYGTFFSQTFAVRHPDKLRTLVLDGAYFVGGTNPWYPDTNRALRHAFTVACRRSPACAHHPWRSMSRITHLTDLLRRHPIVGTAPNADGVVRRIRVGVDSLILLLTDAATTPTIYRELDAATRAALRPRPYVKPLVRLVREDTYVGGAGPVRQYSEGLYVAVECNDYPQPFDVTSPIASRPAQFRAAVAALHRNSPRLFAPFTTSEWVSSSYGYYDDCLRWPRPSRWVHPVPSHASYPHVPTLVLDGDLDSLTSPEGAKATAAAFPNSTFVETANTTHVSALEDFGQCASVIVRRFVRTRRAGDTSCAARYHENRLVDSFVRTAAATGWSGPRRRTARVAAATLADVMARWWSMLGTHGVGLQGGRFTARGGYFASAHPVVRWRLHHVAWVRDVAVTGSMRWHRRTGWVRATVAVTGPGADSGTLRLWWDDQARHAVATASGVLGGQHVTFRFPAS